MQITSTIIHKYTLDCNGGNEGGGRWPGFFRVPVPNNKHTAIIVFAFLSLSVVLFDAAS